MTHSKFKENIKSQIRKNALKYLLKKRKSKGKEIEYINLEMAEYLTPLNRKMNIENKRMMFSVRNRMINIKSNFKQGKTEHRCICGHTETMDHIWICEKVNNEKIQKENYSQIFNGNLTQQIGIFEKFKEKLERYKMMNNKSESKYPRDPCNSDPLLCKEQQGI